MKLQKVETVDFPLTYLRQTEEQKIAEIKRRTYDRANITETFETLKTEHKKEYVLTKNHTHLSRLIQTLKLGCF